ncbi:XVIPCD domain-containing protein [Stenotrophomonas maltophilia]
MSSRFTDWHPHTRKEEPVYAVTVYLAAPGTLISRQGEEDHQSSAGHVYYSISNGRQSESFGFSPIKTGIAGPGRVVYGEHESYQQPAYSRTMEISAAQYQSLREYGQAAAMSNQRFFNLHYNGVTNSCIDFVWIGLNRAGLHPRLPMANGESATIRNFEGAVKVLENIERIRSIPAPVPDSPLNREEHNPLPENRSWLHKRLTERDPEACAVPPVPDSLKDPAHPGHPGYCRALVAVGRMEVAEGIDRGGHSEQLAAAVATRAEREGVGMSELQLTLAGRGEVQVTALSATAPARMFALDSTQALRQSVQQHSDDWRAAPELRERTLARDAEATQMLPHLPASDRRLFEHIREQVPAQLGDGHVLDATIAAREAGIRHANELGSVTLSGERLYLAGTTPGFRATVDVSQPAPPAQEILQRGVELDQQLAWQQAQDMQQPAHPALGPRMG